MITPTRFFTLAAIWQIQPTTYRGIIITLHPKYKNTRAGEIPGYITYQMIVLLEEGYVTRQPMQARSVRLTEKGRREVVCDVTYVKLDGVLKCLPVDYSYAQPMAA